METLVEGQTMWGAEINSATASPKKKWSATLQHLFELDSKINNFCNPASNLHKHCYPKVPSPRNFGSPKKYASPNRAQSPSASDDEEIMSIISYCTFTPTPAEYSEYPSRQDVKKLQLMRLLSMLKSYRKQLPCQILSALVPMISVNLFRPLPPPSCALACILDLPDEDDIAYTFSPIWSHLQIVYDVLLRIVINIDTRILKDYFHNSFLLNLLVLFQSEDPRERESLKNVYHRIYSRFTCHRPFMRKSMNDVFLHYVCDTEKQCGIAELLEIWGTIVNGFTVPLKEEHKLFLMRVLVPLHKIKNMHVYHRQLSYCISQFVQKEPMLGGVVVRGILRYWPVTNCQKEVLLIGELEELVEHLDPDQYRKLALPICSQLTKCLNSWNSQVAERALYVWNNEQFFKMVSTATVEVFPVVIEGMEKNKKWHWSRSVRQLTECVEAMLQEHDPLLYSKSLEDIRAKESAAFQEDMKRKQRWEKIELAAAARNKFRQPSPCICVSY